MAGITVAMTYARALFDAARELDKTELFLSEINGILDQEKENPEFFAFLNSPTVSKQDKKRVLGKVFSGYISNEMLNFLYVLVDKDRTFQLSKIAVQYKHLVKGYEDFACGVVYSATALNPQQMEKLKQQTEKLFGKKVLLENQVDKTLIGGIKIQVDGKLIDQSIKSKLEQMMEQIVN